MRAGKISNMLLTLILVVGMLSAPMMIGASSVPVVSGSDVAGSLDTTTAAPISDPPQPIVSHSIRNDISPLLRSMKPIPPETKAGVREIPLLPLPRQEDHEQKQQGVSGEPILQNQPATPNMPATIQNFEGVSNVDDVQPPDTQGDVGPNHYVQWVNLSFAIWDKDGNLLYGPANGNTLWAGFGGPCEATNDGDPITLYDPLADRWFMSQLALPHFPNGPFYQCIAVSRTGDPTGAWYRYEFVIPISKMNDYPKFGVWPDGYYISVNQFNAGTLTWGGAGVAAFERDSMLNGKVAQMVYFDVGAVTLDFGGMLPADLDGFEPPPAGSPNYFAEWNDSTQLGDPSDTLRLWEFHVDWANPTNSTFGLANHAPNALLPTADVDPDMCGFSRDCIPQPGTGQRLDAISDRLMHRLQYRNFGDYETLVANHTVDADSTDHAGIHWIELHRHGGTWSIHQEGVYAPDTDHRWMGSIAMDHMGNVALGYSVASATTFPSIRYTGRLAGDPLGTMSQGEAELIAGTGSQTGFSNRWGDYSMLAVDPVDDCTFWYTQEYYQTSGYNWQTRIGSFKFPNCTSGPQGTLTGIVYEQDGTPVTDFIAGASVWASFSPTQTFRTSTGADGNYTKLLPADTYTVTAMAYGYQPNSISAVNILSDTTTTLNIPLTPVSVHTVEGIVTDATTGWPVYANITVQGDPINPPAPYNDFWNDPITGYYSITLAEGITYTFNVEAWVPGYLPTIRQVGPLTGDQTENWALDSDPTTCAAPGYSVACAYSEDFEANDGGYTHSGPNDEWEWGSPITWPNGCVSGDRCWGTDLNGNYGNNADQTLYSPVIDLSDISTGTVLTARWWQAWAIESATYDQATVDVSINGNLWTRIWNHTDETTQVDWTEMIYDVSAAAGGSVQFRWRLISDNVINHEGLYVDDVTVSPGCVPPAGGLVVGNIYDDNTDGPVVGADVTNDSGEATTALATTDDPAVEDAFYTLFSPAGSHTFTATMGSGYGTDVALVTAVQSETVRQDLYLPAGWLTYTPDSLVVTLGMSMITTIPLRMSNLGGMPVSFELAEERGGFQIASPLSLMAGYEEWLYRTVEGTSLPTNSGSNALAYPAAYRWEPAVPSQVNILIYADDACHTAPNTYLDQALQALGLAYTAHYDAAWTSFETDLTGGTWDLVLVGNDAWRPPSSVLTALDDYVTGSGKLVYHGWTVSYDPSNPLWATLGFTWVSDNAHSPDPVYWWEPGHLFFTDPQSVPEFTSLTGGIYGIYGQHVEPLAGFEPLAGYTTPGPDPNEAALILGNDDRTVFKGFVDGQNNADLDGDTTPDGVELWINLINGLLNRSSSDVDWLSEEPISSTLGIADQQVILVTFDAGVPSTTQPGEYYARLNLRNDTPYGDLGIPVTMTVPPPPTWGKLAGTVTSLGYCDANPAPLEGAAVLVTGISGMDWTLTTDINGTYSLWVEQGSHTVTVSAADHVTGAALVTVTAQATTVQDVGLRSVEPCISIAPLSMAATLIPGASETQILALTNSGAGASLFGLRATTQTLALTNAGVSASFSEPRETTQPITFGYTYRDSSEPDGPTYQWVDIAATGTPVYLYDDDGDGPFPIGFTFNFYGNDYTDLYVSSNGYLSFNNLDLTDYGNDCPLPNANTPNDSIYLMWDDLDPNDTGDPVYYQSFSSCPYGGGACLVVQYESYHHYPGGGSIAGTWEAILFENGSTLIQFEDAGTEKGSGSTTGIENSDATLGLTYACDTGASLSDNLAVCFAYPGQPTDCLHSGVPWLSTEPGAGTVEADSTQAITVTLTALSAMNTSVYTDVYTAALKIRTDDAVNPQFYVPVTLTIPVFHRHYLPLIFRNS